MSDQPQDVATASPCPDSPSKDTLNWISTLIRNYDEVGQCTDESCPFCKAVITFQQFANIVLEALRSNDAVAAQAATNGTLGKLFTHVIDLTDADTFHPWVKEAMVYNPFSLQEMQFSFRKTVEAQLIPSLSLLEKFELVKTEYISWWDLAHDLETIQKDPSKLKPFEINNIQKIHRGDENAPGPEDTCLLCGERFVPVESSEETDAHSPCAATCGHLACHSCFLNWLKESKGSFTCPWCRACLVCGDTRYPCPYHTIRLDVEVPTSLTYLLALRAQTKEATDAANVSGSLLVEGLFPAAFYTPGKGMLRGLRPVAFRALRESSRDMRAHLASLVNLLKGDVDESDPATILLRCECTHCLRAIFEMIDIFREIQTQEQHDSTA